MEILFHYLDMLRGVVSCLMTWITACSFDLACKQGFKKMQFALGNEDNTKQSLALEPGILVLASDPFSQ